MMNTITVVSLTIYMIRIFLSSCLDQTPSRYLNSSVCPVPVYGWSLSSLRSFSSFLKSCGEDFLINRTCFTASLENSISYIAFVLYTVKKIVQRLVFSHSEGISFLTSSIPLWIAASSSFEGKSPSLTARTMIGAALRLETRIVSVSAISKYFFWLARNSRVVTICIVLIYWFTPQK